MFSSSNNKGIPFPLKTKNPPQDLHSIQLQLTGSIGFEDPSSERGRVRCWCWGWRRLCEAHKTWRKGTNSKALTSQRYYKTKTKCQNPRRLCERTLPHPTRTCTCVTVTSSERVESGEEVFVASSSLLVMMAANAGAVIVSLCACMHLSVSEQELERWESNISLVFIGDWDCGLAYLHSNSSVNAGVDVDVDVGVATASRRNESKQANKQMRHQSCH